jgi:hypothetical protein
VLTPDDRIAIKYHLGYPNAQAIETFVLGVPAAMEPLFMLEGAMNAVAPAAEERIRKTLRRLEAVEEQIEENQDALVLSKADEVEFRENELELLQKRYAWWQGNLCNLLGVPCPNPFDARNMAIDGINLSVQH